MSDEHHGIICSIPLSCGRCGKTWGEVSICILMYCIGGCNKGYCPDCLTPEEKKEQWCGHCKAHPENSAGYKMGRRLAEWHQGRVLKAINGEGGGE